MIIIVWFVQNIVVISVIAVVNINLIVSVIIIIHIFSNHNSDYI